MMLQMGAASDGGGSNAMTLIEMMSVKAAKDLALDMSIQK